MQDGKMLLMAYKSAVTQLSAARLSYREVQVQSMKISHNTNTLEGKV